MNENCKLTDFERNDLVTMGKVLHKVLRTKLHEPDQRESLELWFTQIINAINTVDAKEKVNQN